MPGRLFRRQKNCIGQLVFSVPDRVGLVLLYLFRFYPL
jgi:hypothetical protein